MAGCEVLVVWDIVDNGGVVAGHEALAVWGTVDRGGWRGART